MLPPSANHSANSSMRDRGQGPSPRGGWGRHYGQVSLIHALGLLTIPSPTTSARSFSPRHLTGRRIEPRPHPPWGNLRLRLGKAGSPHDVGRIEFLIVRTSRSPPAALPLASRRRSCIQLPSYVDSKRTSTSPTKRALRRTLPGTAGGSPFVLDKIDMLRIAIPHRWATWVGGPPP